jgi:hypothetical protein
MRAFYSLVGLLFLLAAPALFCVVVVDDLRHPERWGEDWTHDPRLLPLVLVPLALAVFWYFVEVRKLARLREKLEQNKGRDPNTRRPT